MEEIVSTLSALLAEELKLFSKVNELQNKLEKSLAADPPDFAVVMDILEQKNRLLDRVSETGRRSEPWVGRWQTISDEERRGKAADGIRDALAQVEVVVRGIRDRDMELMARFEKGLSRAASPQNMLDAYRAMN